MLGGSSFRSQGGGLLKRRSLEEGEEELGCCLGNFCKKPNTKNKVEQLGRISDKKIGRIRISKLK